MKWSRTQAGKAHENGDVEQAHHRLKRAIEQELLLRGSRDFLERDDYERFIQRIIERRNAGRLKRLGEELEVMAPLPDRRLEGLHWLPRESLSEFNHPSPQQHLLGRQPLDPREGGGTDVGRITWRCGMPARWWPGCPDCEARAKHRIDYRHVIHSLVRKPGAFARYRWREDLFPGVLFSSRLR